MLHNTDAMDTPAGILREVNSLLYKVNNSNEVTTTNLNNNPPSCVDELVTAIERIIFDQAGECLYYSRMCTCRNLNIFVEGSDDQGPTYFSIMTSKGRLFFP